MIIRTLNTIDSPTAFFATSATVGSLIIFLAGSAVLGQFLAAENPAIARLQTRQRNPYTTAYAGIRVNSWQIALSLGVAGTRDIVFSMNPWASSGSRRTT
jgi:hypothetical protein